MTDGVLANFAYYKKKKSEATNFIKLSFIRLTTFEVHAQDGANPFLWRGKNTMAKAHDYIMNKNTETERETRMP